jgi:hypothetical protein
MERTEEMSRASAPSKLVDGHYVDWPAILGGGVVAVAVASVFTGFGAALGLSTISAEPGEGSFNVMVIVSALWIAVTLVASYMTGGYVAGRMRRRIDAAPANEITVRDGINGLVVWGLGIVVSVLLLGSAVSTTLSTAGSVVSSATSAAGAVLGGAAQGVLSDGGAMGLATAETDPMAYVSSTLLRPAQVVPATNAPTGPAAADLSNEASVILGNIVATGEISGAERAYLESAVVTNAGVTQPDAAARVDAAVTAAQDRRDQIAKAAKDAEDLAIKAAEVARVSGILTAFLLAAAALVAGAAAYIGAVHGGRHRDAGRIFGGFGYSR